jgi:hypothetical protein
MSDAVGEARLPVAMSAKRRKAAIFPLTAERNRRARMLLADSKATQRFWAFRPGAENDLKPDSDEYEKTQAFEKAIDEYFGFRIDYYPFFEPAGGNMPVAAWNIFDPRTWIYFVDINDEVTEQKFKVDQDVRAFITAFRISIERNRWKIIRLKRFIQTANLIGAFLPSVFVAFLPLLKDFGVPVVKLDTPWALGLALAYAAVFFLGSWLLLWYQGTRESQLSTVISNNGKTLGSAMQRRANNLGKNFVTFLAKIDAEEATRKMADASWTDRSAWWMKLSLWNPKRIEYMEKFFQSEMQRTRIFMLRSGWSGYGLAVVSLAAVTAAAAFLIGVEFGLASLLKHESLRPVASLLLFAGGLVLGFWFTRRSLKSSITLQDISVPLGLEPLGENARFADVMLHEKVSEQIRKDKEKIRQANLRGGGFGDGGPRGN